MKENFKITKSMGKECSNLRMGIFMMASGLMMKFKGKGN